MMNDRTEPASQDAAEVPLRPQQHERDDQSREGEQDQQAGRDHRPAEHRHPHQRHLRRAAAQRRRQQAGRPQHLPERRHHDAEDPQFHAAARRVDRVGERIKAPPRRGRRAAAGQEARPHRDPTEHEQPEAGERDARSGDLGRANLQRHEVQPDGEADRHDEQVNHRRAVHREQLVVGVL
jgi:hypothetical protein